MNDRVAINPGTVGVLLPTVTGAGYIDHLWACGNDQTNVQVTVDGEATPSINLPIRFLTGGFYSNDGQGPFTGRFITANGDPGVPVLCGSMNLPIPFGTSVSVGLQNNGSSVFYTASVVTYQTGISNNWPRTQRLHIDWGCDNSATSDPDCVGTGLLAQYGTQVMCCSISGKEGRFVGFSWLYDGYPGNVTWYGGAATPPLEGNFEFYVDGAGSPTYASSGAEDIFEMSFYFNQFAAPFTGNPDIGLTWKNDWTFGAWRFYIDDPIMFNNSLTMQWHCGQAGEPLGVSWSGSCAVYWSAYYYTTI
ncbi:MAG TPA: DUF2961 domain-containing protein [Terriglobales bacterium]|nr:DUF2961 domain-containing protein [Terriglobales bacterium]